MSELEEKLNSILGNPQAMGQIMALAQSLGGSAPGKGGPEAAGSGTQGPEPSQGAPQELPQSAQVSQPSQPLSQPQMSGGQAADGQLSALLTALGGGGLDPKLLEFAARVMAESGGGEDGRTALLQALRPFVRPERYARLDRAVQIARMSRLIRVAIDVGKGGGGKDV